MSTTTTTIPTTTLDSDWVRSPQWQAPSGRYLSPGTEVTIAGARGRYRFVEHVSTPAGAEWLSVYGPVKGGVRTCRSFDPARVKVVHSKTKGRC